LSAVNCFGNKPEPELDRILINDISRQLASYLDQVALYGADRRQISRLG
jgi:hypothetical protein